MRASAAEVELRVDARWRQQRAQQIEEGRREAGAAADEVERELRALGASVTELPSHSKLIDLLMVLDS